MDIKRLLSQVLAAIFLFTLISVILEKEYTQEVIWEKLQTGVLFGLVYGVYLWARHRFRDKRK